MTASTVYDVTDHALAAEQIRVHEKMLEWIVRLAPRSVLEIGSGTGALGAKIAALGCEYVGLEPDEVQFELARQQHPGIRYLRESCYEPPEKMNLGQFDVVLSNDVIEHLYLPRKLVGFAKAHMKPGGAVVTATPDYGNYWRNLMISATARWDHHHSPLWDGGHVKFFSRKTLQSIFAEQGFTRFEWGSVRSVRAPIFPMSIICGARLPA